MISHRAVLWVVVAVCFVGCEDVQPAEPSDSIESPWQFSIEFALEDYGDPGEYTARARLYDALTVLDLSSNAGKSLRLSEGDEVYVEDVHLDAETRTVWLDRESYDYSTTIASERNAYRFEFRRPDETIRATVPSPPPFEADDIGDVAHSAGTMKLVWTPLADERWASSRHPEDDSDRRTRVNISIEALDDGCITVIDGNTVAPVVQNTPDTGSYLFSAGSYHSPDHDCRYDIIYERVSAHNVPGTWTKDGVEAPTGGATAFGRHTIRKRFVALQQ